MTTLSSVEELAGEIEPAMPNDAIAFIRILNLKAMLQFIDDNIRPQLGENVSLQDACKRVFRNETAKNAILAKFKYLSPYVEEYFRK